MLPPIHSVHSVPAEHQSGITTALLQGSRFTAGSLAASSKEFWHEQDLPEWFVLIAGSASLEFGSGTLDLGTGDYVIIPEHVKHRVSAKSADAAWITLHAEPDRALARMGA